MKLQQLLEMPQLTRRELGDDPSDDAQPMTPFFMTTERMNERYMVLSTSNNVVSLLSKNKSSAMIGVFGKRHDGADGVDIFGQLEFKDNYNLGTAADAMQLRSQNVLQVSLVTVVKEDKFKGLGSFLYSALVQQGYTIISDTHHFDGGKALWQKLGRAHNANEVIYLIDRGNVLKDELGNPIEYNGNNIPEDRIWSEDETNKYVLFIYRHR